MPRVEALRERLRCEGLGGLLVTGPESRRYLSGFTGSAGSLLILPDRAALLTDFRYVEQARGQAPDVEVVQTAQQPLETLGQLVRDHGVTRLGFEKDNLTYGYYQQLGARLPGVELVPVSGWVEALRQVKEDAEVDQIARAQSLVDKGFRQILDFIRPGRTEKEIAVELEYNLLRLGADRMAFDTIVVSGPRSSLPHGRPGERQLQPGDLVTIDVGVMVDGYCSDLTRTVAVGRLDVQQRRIHDLVLRAQEAALLAARPGVGCAGLDRVAREVISAAGYGDCFGHGLGHGVGLAVHEGPRVSQSAPPEQELVVGNVITVEPGVYIPGWGGVRIEDLVVITPNGCRNLTTSPKHLIIVS